MARSYLHADVESNQLKATYSRETFVASDFDSMTFS
jgi:hypothetical protein